MNGVQVWRADLDSIPLAALADLLDDEERARAARFRFDQHRARFIVSHGVLRKILGRYLKADPAALRFRSSPRGKPYLDPACDLQFNLSHSSGLGIYAVTFGRRVGVDIERIEARPDLLEVARRFFTPEEFALLEPNRSLELFYRIWTRKEAWLKATGEGLRAIGTSPDPSRWHICDLAIERDYAAALATEGAEPEIQYFDFAAAG